MNRRVRCNILTALLLSLLLLLGLTACGREAVTQDGAITKSATDESGTADGSGKEAASALASADKSESAAPNTSEASQDAGESEAAVSGAGSGEGNEGVAWPKEFKAWGIPTIKDAKLSFADNKSAAGNTMTAGVTASVVIDKLTRKQFDQYTEALLDAGFAKAEGSIDVLLQAHEKTVPEGVIRLMLTHDEETTSIIATHSGAAAIKDAEALANAGKGPDTKDWPDALKAVPLFPAGAFKEMLAMGENFFTLSWLDVTQADWDAYTKTLVREGFVETDLGDTIGYIKMDGKNVTNVSGMLTDGTLQLVVVTGTME